MLVLALSACGGAGGPSPAPTAAAQTHTAPTDTPAPATPHPTPTQAQDSDPAIAVQVSTSGAEVIQASGRTTWVFFNNPAADAVATFTRVFGVAPVVTDRPAGSETPPSRVYDWSGFSVIDGDGRTISLSDFVIDVSVAAVGGVDIVAVPGLHVGAPFSSAVLVEDSDGGFPGLGLAAVDTQAVDPVDVGEAPGTPLAVYLAVYGSPSGAGPIAHFTAPTPNWGD